METFATNMYRAMPLEKRIVINDSYSKMIYEVFILSLILTWLPFKAFAYAAPYILVLYTFIVYNYYNLTLNLIKCILACTIFIGINFFLREDFIFSNGILAIITYGSFLFLFAMPNRKLSLTYEYKIYKILRIVVIFQSVFGIIQFLIAYVKFGSYSVDMGDFIQGTIVPLSFNLEGDRGIGNAYFVINILIMMLFIMTDPNKTKKTYGVVLIGSIAAVLAGVHHALVSLFLAFLISLVIIDLKKAIKYSFVIIPVVAITLTAFYLLNPNNVYLYSHYFNLYSTGESFKTIAMKMAFVDLYEDHFDISLIGTGPGQFSSRAGLIASGTYLGGLDENRTIPFFSIEKSSYFKNYAFEVYYSMKTDKSTVHGAASRTFFSLMSLCIELGIILFSIVIYFIIKGLIFIRRKYEVFKSLNSIQERDIAIMLSCSILFFVFISFFENYLEMIQATLSCFILMKIFYNKITSVYKN
ncbi:hypothetical protein BN8_02616 [Fibrisoma limi BUZ 3]|uniref:O-antigen polymerase n=1 Tax=Fibrisoma limi BUZ 3 TaxID=1185876 RepID=I2GHZ1_9BACT|nr:hypothetical protein [Fibrisoma limi]CCH53516.1 hypothetical protein BN8_02616 [Fibrisoma limi BUZ 3]